MAIFRVLEPDDAPVVWELLYHALHVPPGFPPFQPGIVHEPEFRRYADSWGQPNDDGLLDVGEDGPVGGAWIRLFSALEPGFGFVDEFTPELSVAVFPAHRGRGIGTALVHGLVSRAEERFPAVSLSVSTTNPALRLYERLGFKPLMQNGSSLTMLHRRS